MARFWNALVHRTQVLWHRTRVFSFQAGQTLATLWLAGIDRVGIALDHIAYVGSSLGWWIWSKLAAFGKWIRNWALSDWGREEKSLLRRGLYFVARCLIVGVYYFGIYLFLRSLWIHSGVYILMLLIALLGLGSVVFSAFGGLKTSTKHGQKIGGGCLDGCLSYLVLRPAAWAVGISLEDKKQKDSGGQGQKQP